MTDPIPMHSLDALVDAIDASDGFPVPTPREFAARIEEQLANRGYEITRASQSRRRFPRTSELTERELDELEEGAAMAQAEMDPDDVDRRW